MIKEAETKDSVNKSESDSEVQKNKYKNLEATSTNPFVGERRKLHKAWMSVMAEGNLTPKK